MTAGNTSAFAGYHQSTVFNLRSHKRVRGGGLFIRRGSRVSLIKYFQVDVLYSVQLPVIQIHYLGLGLIYEIERQCFQKFMPERGDYKKANKKAEI